MAAASCVSFDGACTGDHGSSGNCCAPYYCHKNDPTWAQGRCYNPVPVPGGPALLVPASATVAPTSGLVAAVPVIGVPSAPVLLKSTCADHDGECSGPHGTQSDCCANLYCHKGNPAWAKGRCYFSNPAAAAAAAATAAPPSVPLLPDSPFIPLQVASAAAATSSGGVPVQNARRQSARLTVQGAGVAGACVLPDGSCLGDPGAKGDCCDGSYCHKDDYSWPTGRCRRNPVL